MFMSLLHTPSQIPGPILTSPKQRQSPIEIKPLGYNKQYHSWELVCHSVKDLVLRPRPKSQEEDKGPSVCPLLHE